MGKAGKRQRLDLLMVARGLAESEEQARRLIMAGEVLVDEEVWDKPGRLAGVEATVRVREGRRYVSRGGVKLAAALDAFGLEVAGLTAVDVGASTGGFTDCLLQRGAAHVFAVDVGYGLLAWKLRSDARVTVLERTNVRYLEALPGGARVDLAVVDASFISLGLVLPATLRLLKQAGQVVALVKPQFEAGKGQVETGGVVRDRRVHRRVLEEAVAVAGELGLAVGGLIASPIRGPAGNVEFLIWMGEGIAAVGDVDGMIEEALTAAV